MDHGADILLQAEGVARRDGPRMRLHPLDLTLHRGEVTALLGVNGAGKSTALALLAGALRPSQGHIRVAGIDLSSRPRDARRLLGLLPERPPFHPDLTVEENLVFAARLRGLDRRGARAAARRAAERLELDRLRHRLAGRLSRGMGQRLGIAQALVHDPPVLILDEPTAGLDPGQARALRTLIGTLGRERAVLMATHILADVAQSCRRVVLLRGGRKIRDERVERDAHARLKLLRPPAPDALERLPGVLRARPLEGGVFELRLRDAPPDLAETVAREGWGLVWFQRDTTPMEHWLAELVDTEPQAA